MNCNVFGNFGGHGGYQILSENFLTSLRLVSNGSYSKSVNMFPIVSGDSIDPFTRRAQRSGANLSNGLAPVSIGLVSAAHAQLFSGKTRVLYPMHECTKLTKGEVNNLNSMDEIWVSSLFNKLIFEKNGVNKDNIKLLHAGVNTNQFRPLYNTDKHLLSYRVKRGGELSGDKPFTFLQVGKYENRKGSKETVEAFLKAFNNHPLVDKVQLLVKWSTTVRVRPLQTIKQELQPLFKKYPRAATRVHLLDEKGLSMTEVYNNADCFVFPSRSEGIGLPLLEAMGCGLPCITTNSGSLADYNNPEGSIILKTQDLEPVNDYYYGLNEKDHGVWSTINIDELSDAYLEMLNHSFKTRFEMGQKNREYVISNFSLIKFGQRIYDLLEDLEQ